MKKMISATVILAVVSVFGLAGCEKSNTSAPKPAEQSSPTSTATPAKPHAGC